MSDLSEVFAVFRCVYGHVHRTEYPVVSECYGAEGNAAVCCSVHLHYSLERLVIPAGKVAAVVWAFAPDAVGKQIRTIVCVVVVGRCEGLYWASHGLVGCECLLVSPA